MPTGFFYAPMLFKFKGVTIYGVYVDDDARKGKRKGRYGVTPLVSDLDNSSFDIKELDNFKEGIAEHLLLEEAIEKNILTDTGILSKKEEKSKSYIDLSSRHYSVGDRVVHKLHGKGMVCRDSRDEVDHMLVLVSFAVKVLQVSKGDFIEELIA